MKTMKLIYVLMISFFVFCIQSVFSQDFYYGNGNDGSPTVSVELKTDGTRGIADAIDLSTREITLNNVTGIFSIGDRVLIIQMEGANAGDYEVNKVMQVNGNVLQMTGALLNVYNVGEVVQVLRIPQYTNLTVNNSGTVTCEPYDPSTGGGIICFFVSGLLTIEDNGTIDASGKGYPGGSGGNGGPTNVNNGTVGKGGEKDGDKDKRNRTDAGDIDHAYRLSSWFIDNGFNNPNNYEGGNGGAGGTAKPGIPGQSGTDGKSTTATPNNFTKLLLGNGGNGGNGGTSGGAGGHGGGGGAGGAKGNADGTDGTAGANGYPGGDGGNGGNGGGAVYIRAMDVDINASNAPHIILTNGENGLIGQDGNGSGIGGKGGDGGNGADGGCGVYGPGAPGTPGQNGNGAGAGDGGDGGDAGMILFEHGNNQQQPNISHSLAGGIGGDGGTGAEPNPSIGSVGTWGTLDLANCTWSSYDDITTTEEYDCRCEDAFRHLSYCENATYNSANNEWYFWNNAGTISATYSEDDIKLSTDVTTTISGGTTRPNEEHHDIYHCELDDATQNNDCKYCFNGMGQGVLPGYNGQSYVWFDNQTYEYAKITGLLTDGSYFCNASCLDWSSCLYAYCPQAGSDGDKGTDGASNSYFFMRYHENTQTYRNNSTGSIEAELDQTAFSIYPNPTGSEFRISFESEANKDFVFELYSASGQKISSRHYTTKAKVTKLDFNIQNLESGIYYLKIKTGNKSTSVSITKI